MPEDRQGKPGMYAIKVIWADGEEEFVKQGLGSTPALLNHEFQGAASPPVAAAVGWVNTKESLPDDDSDVFAAIAWTHSPGVRQYVIHDCAYYEGGTGSGQKIFTDCEGEEFEAKDVGFWIYKYKLAEQLPRPEVAAAEQVKLGGMVYVNNQQFTGYGIAVCDSGNRKRVIGVLLENGNTWNYDAETVRNAQPDEFHKAPRVLRERFEAAPLTPRKEME